MNLCKYQELFENNQTMDAQIVAVSAYDTTLGDQVEIENVYHCVNNDETLPTNQRNTDVPGVQGEYLTTNTSILYRFDPQPHTHELINADLNDINEIVLRELHQNQTSH